MVDISITSVDITEDCTLAQQISITKSFTINGNGYTITAANDTGHFFIDTTSNGPAKDNPSLVFTIENAVLEGGNAADARETFGLKNADKTKWNGGSILVRTVKKANPGNLFPHIVCNNCTFSNNKAQYRGSAIYIEHGGKLTLTDTIFVGNKIMNEDKTTDLDEDYHGGGNGVIEFKEFANDEVQTFENVQFVDNLICDDAICVPGREVHLDLLADDINTATERPIFDLFKTRMKEFRSDARYVTTKLTTTYTIKRINSLIETIIDRSMTAGHTSLPTSCTSNNCNTLLGVSDAECAIHTDVNTNPQGIFCFEKCNSTAGYGLKTPIDLDSHCRECSLLEHTASESNFCVRDTVYQCTAGKGLVGITNTADDTSCETCTLGQYASGNADEVCKECGDGHTVFDASYNIVNESGTQCIPCNGAIEYDHDNESHTACISTNGRCDQGFEILGTDVLTAPNYCSICKYGYYQPLANTSDKCKAWTSIGECNGFYIPGNIYKDSQCSFQENLNEKYIYLEPSDRSFEITTYCFPNTFQYLNSDGKIECRTCNPSLFLTSYNLNTMNSTDISVRHGGCCSNAHHHVCTKLIQTYRAACETPSKGDVSKCKTTE
jgi:hypothetical protein